MLNRFTWIYDYKRIDHAMNKGNVNIINSFDRLGSFGGKGIGNITSSGDDYVAVNDQNNNNNINTLDEINNNSENKN